MNNKEKTMDKVIQVDDFAGKNLYYATVWVSKPCEHGNAIRRDYRKINKIEIYCQVNAKRFCEIVKDEVESSIKLGILKNPVNICGKIEKALDKFFDFLAWNKIGFKDLSSSIGIEPVITLNDRDDRVTMVRRFLYETIEEDYRGVVDKLCQDNKKAFHRELTQYTFDFWDEFIVNCLGEGFSEKFGMFHSNELRDFIERYPDCKDVMINAFLDGKYYPLTKRGGIKGLWLVKAVSRYTKSFEVIRRYTKLFAHAVRGKI